MKKSELVARCLLAARIVANVEDGLAIFHRVWQAHFSGRNLAQWDTPVPDWLQERLLQVAAKSHRIKVDKLIEDLTDSSQKS